MPQYKRNLLENYPREFWRSLLNPEGHVYRCFFCDEFFETKSQSIQHMKVCALEETGEEYDETYLVYEDIRLRDKLNDNEIYDSTIKEFIRSNMLESLTDQTGEAIQAYILEKLIENGMKSPSSWMVYEIYAFFFEASSADRFLFRNKWANELANRL
jgi:hypothetical protein